MRCPLCDSRAKAVRTIPRGWCVERERKCSRKACGHRFRTEEALKDGATARAEKIHRKLDGLLKQLDPGTP